MDDTGELPPFRWHQAHCDALRRRRQLLRRTCVVGALIGLMAGTSIIRPRPRLVWNASASAPIGLYLVVPGSVPDVGDMVVARPPARVRALAARRLYLPADVPLVKRAAAAAGDRICASRDALFVNARRVAVRRKYDTRGRLLPWWNGCHVLTHGELLLLMAEHPASFDGRYFGVSARADVIGKARLLWPR